MPVPSTPNLARQEATGPKCPLSQSADVTLVESLRTRDLQRLYKKFNIDIARLMEGSPTLDLYHSRESDVCFFWPLITGDQAFYAALQQHNWYYLESKPEYDVARQYISRCDTVLEVGCGAGLFVSHIDSSAYVGLEFSEHAVEAARRRGLDVRMESIRAHAKHHTGVYDVVCSFQVLEHVSETHDFLESSLSALRPGGRLIVSVPSRDSFLSLATNNILNMPPHHITWWSDTALRYIGRRFALNILALEHDALAEIHKRWYAQTLIVQSLLRARPRLLDTRLHIRIAHKFASLAGRFLALGFRDTRMLPYGHSVTAVYEKPK